MPPTIERLANAILVPHCDSRYKHLTSEESAQMRLSVPLNEKDSPIGIYYNVPDQLESSVLVTVFGLLMMKPDGPESVAYDDMERSRPAGERKRDWDEKQELTIFLKDGSQLNVLIAGIDKSRCLYMLTFDRFLWKVIFWNEKAKSSKH